MVDSLIWFMRICGLCSAISNIITAIDLLNEQHYLNCYVSSNFGLLFCHLLQCPIDPLHLHQLLGLK